MIDPFIKWVGGKRKLRDRVISVFPRLAPGATYFEPFLGGGAIFFAYQPNASRLSDANADLIETYMALRDDVDQIISLLSTFAVSEDRYYEIRAWHPTTSVERAARFIYLNKTCFNGIYRVNVRGEFNVPYGRPEPSRVICDVPQLRAASQALQNAELECGDFEDAVASSQPGDLVYFDPPYTTAHSNNGFIEYNARVFSWDDQKRLACVASTLVDRGVSVVISNANHPSIVECFSREGRFHFDEVPRWSTIASKSSKRFQTSELIIMGVQEGA